MRSFDNPPRTALAGTFDWIWKDANGFSKWLREPDGLYWIQGRPGSGKTTLVGTISCTTQLRAALIGKTPETLVPSEHAAAIAAHYFQANDSSEARSIEGMLRSLIWDLCRQMPSVAVEMLIRRFNRIKQTTSEFEWSETELKAALQEMVARCPEMAVTLFIDGLDEHDGKDAKIADLVCDLRRNLPKRVRICVSSRPYPDFMAEFKESRGFKMHEHISHDISLYVDHRIKEFEKFEDCAQRVSQLSDEIKTRARDSFLWVRLACDELQNHWRRHRSFEILQRALQELPKELETFYARIVDGLDDREVTELLSVLSLVTKSKKTLTIREFLFAFDYKLNISKLKVANNGEWELLDDETFFGEDWLEPRKQKTGGLESIRRKAFGFKGSRGRRYRMTRRNPFPHGFQKTQERIELIGRGFLTAEGDLVQVSHETMQAFVSKLLQRMDATSYTRGDVQLLIASALCFRACQHRDVRLHLPVKSKPTDFAYPFLDVIRRYEWGDSESDSDSETGIHTPTAIQRRSPPRHVFQKYLSSDVFRSNDVIVRHARMIESSYYTSNDCNIQEVLSPTLGLWLEVKAHRSPYERAYRTVNLGILTRQSTPQSILLKFLMSTGCDAASFFLETSLSADKATLVGSNAKATIDVNQSEGYWLFLAADTDNATLLTCLVNAGAKIGSKLPLASTAVHHAVLRGHTRFTKEFLRLFIDGKIPVATGSQEPFRLDPRIVEIAPPGIKSYWRRMEDLGFPSEASDRTHLLALACPVANTDTIDALLEFYPEWENLIGTRQSTLVTAAFFGPLDVVRKLLYPDGKQANDRRRLPPPCGPDVSRQEREDRFLALIAAVDRSHGDIVDELLQAGIAPAAPDEPQSKRWIPVGAGEISLTPLHLALTKFRSRSVEASKHIVLSLAANGAILSAQVQNVLPKMVDLGMLHEEDYEWVITLFPGNELGPEDVTRGFKDYTQLPGDLWDGDDSDEADGSSVFESSDMADDEDYASSGSFLSAREALSESEDTGTGESAE